MSPPRRFLSADVTACFDTVRSSRHDTWPASSIDACFRVATELDALWT